MHENLQLWYVVHAKRVCCSRFPPVFHIYDSPSDMLLHFDVTPQDKRRVDIEKEKLDEEIRIKDLEMQFRIAMQNIDSDIIPVSREMSARERVLSAKLAQSRQATPPQQNRR
jgi:hypothetical protein